MVKGTDGAVTASSVRQLTGDEREAEMARLLSGLTDSESGLAHARELLGDRVGPGGVNCAASRRTTRSRRGSEATKGERVGHVATNDGERGLD